MIQKKKRVAKQDDRIEGVRRKGPKKGSNLRMRSENSSNNPEVRPPETLFNILKRTRNSREACIAEMYHVTSGERNCTHRQRSKKGNILYQNQ